MKEYIYFKHLSSIQAQFSKFSIIITTLHIPLLLKMTILSFNLWLAVILKKTTEKFIAALFTIVEAT